MLNFMGTGDCGAQEAFLISVCFLLLFPSTYALSVFYPSVSASRPSVLLPFLFFFLLSASVSLFLIFLCSSASCPFVLLLYCSAAFPFFNALPCLASTLRFLLSAFCFLFMSSTLLLLALRLSVEER